MGRAKRQGLRLLQISLSDLDRAILCTVTDWVTIIGMVFVLTLALNVVNPLFRSVPTPDYISPLSMRGEVGNCLHRDEAGNCTSTLVCSAYLNAGKPAWKCAEVG